MHQLSSPHRRIRLHDLPTSIRGDGVDRFEFQSCSSSWQHCQPNDLFVAINGQDGDGHDDVQRAITQGARAILAERLLPVEIPLFLTSDTREAFGHICHQLSGNPSHALQTIGVTGTSGKSTIAGMLNRILTVAGHGCLTVANGESSAESQKLTGDREFSSPEIAVGLSDAVAVGHSHSVLELSSDELARRVWSGTRLDIALLNGLSADFRDWHGTSENYVRASERILDLLKDAGLVVVNADDARLRNLLDRLPFPALSYGIRNEAEIMGEVLEETPTEQTIMIHAGYESMPVRLARPGRHWLTNALAATTAALALGLDLPVIQKGLEAYFPKSGSLELIRQERTASSVYLDQAIYPDRLRASLATLYRNRVGKLWCVMEVSDRLASKHRSSMGALLERYAHGAAIAVSPDVAVDGFAAIHDVMDGYERAGRDQVAPQIETALEWVLSQAGAGDTILVAADSASSPAIRQLLQARDETRPRGTECEPVIFRLDDYRDRG